MYASCRFGYADALPATEILEGENIFVMTEFRALHQDIRPLRVLILNLMPTKIATETQLMRKLSNTPLRINAVPDLLRTKSHEATHVSAGHLRDDFTAPLRTSKTSIMTVSILPAPVSRMEFEEVDYWEELCRIMDWSSTRMCIPRCISAGARRRACTARYGIRKCRLPKKASGVFEHRLLKPKSPLVRGFDDRICAVHARNTDVKIEDVEAVDDLEIVAVSNEVGPSTSVKSVDSRRFLRVRPSRVRYTDTLKLEYERDVKRGINPEIPVNYFPDDDPTRAPLNIWRSQAQLFYTNWLNYYVYQTTPYDLEKVGEYSSQARRSSKACPCRRDNVYPGPPSGGSLPKTFRRQEFPRP